MMETINKIILCIWGGLFIAFGALASAGLPAPLNGIIFSTGLLCILCTQSSLFTGSILGIKNGLSIKLLSNWLLIFIGNFIGCYLLAKLVLLGGYNIDTITTIAQNKANLTPLQAFLRAIPCNILVCLAVIIWRNIDKDIIKIILVMLCITTFIVCGFEHSVANMFYYAFSNYNNLAAVTLGNILGGCFVAFSFK